MIKNDKKNYKIKRQKKIKNSKKKQKNFFYFS